MTDETLISTDQGTGRVAPPGKTGFYYNWGPQAWIDMWMSNTMLVKKAMPIISHTFVPILRLSGDKEQVDRDYEEIKSRREIIKLFDSPREKWRKRYGNFVREVEWALLELRKHYSQKQYEEIVIGTSVALSHETSADFLKMMNSMSDKNKNKKTRPAKTAVHQTRSLEHLPVRNLQPCALADRARDDHRVRSRQRPDGDGDTRLRLAHLRRARIACPTPMLCPRKAVSTSARGPSKHCSRARAAA